MALNNSFTFFLLALLLLTSLNPLAHAITPNLAGLTVIGQLCCTSTGNCIVGGRGVANVTVLVNCTNTAGGVVTVGQGTTNIDGAFTGSFSNLTGINALMPCTACVQLPLPATTCPELSNISREMTHVVGNTQFLGNKQLLGNVGILGANSANQLVGNVGILSAQVNVGGDGLVGNVGILATQENVVQTGTIGVWLRT